MVEKEVGSDHLPLVQSAHIAAAFLVEMLHPIGSCLPSLSRAVSASGAIFWMLMAKHFEIRCWVEMERGQRAACCWGCQLPPELKMLVPIPEQLSLRVNQKII